MCAFHVPDCACIRAAGMADYACSLVCLRGCGIHPDGVCSSQMEKLCGKRRLICVKKDTQISGIKIKISIIIIIKQPVLIERMKGL